MVLNASIDLKLIDRLDVNSCQVNHYAFEEAVKRSHHLNAGHLFLGLARWTDGIDRMRALSSLHITYQQALEAFDKVCKPRPGFRPPYFEDSYLLALDKAQMNSKQTMLNLDYIAVGILFGIYNDEELREMFKLLKLEPVKAWKTALEFVGFPFIEPKNVAQSNEYSVDEATGFIKTAT